MIKQKLRFKYKISLMLVSVIAACCLNVDANEPDPLTKRMTKYGEVIGYTDAKGTNIWQGIPFAKPPIGDLRWRAPVASDKWGQQLKALRPGSACSQPHLPRDLALQDDEYAWGAEDCLYLNIWTPPGAADQYELLPVMFWVHGGNNEFGEGGSYDGSTLATSQRVVVVTVNYRLGFMGWFRHHSLSQKNSSAEDKSGNYGILDLIEGLQWVKGNIQSFGGNPDSITVFGESAGGRDIHALMVSPPAKGLFDRAIIQSGLTLTFPVQEASNFSDDDQPGHIQSSNEILLQLIIDDGFSLDRLSAKEHLNSMSENEIAAYLHSKSFSEIDKAGLRIVETFKKSDRPFGKVSRFPQLIEDGAVLPKSGIVQAYSDGRFNHVPVILGSTRDEDVLFMASALENFEDEKTFLLAAEYLSLLWKEESVDEPAVLLVKPLKGALFGYRFDWDEQGPIDSLFGRTYAMHGLDVPFTFGNFNSGPMFDFFTKQIKEGDTESYRRLSSVMMSYWAEFAYSGNHGTGRQGDLPRWLPWSAEHDGVKTILLDTVNSGGLVMSRESVTKSQILTWLEKDSRLSSLEGKCVFFQKLLNYYKLVERLNSTDYLNFMSGACVKDRPF